MKSKPKTAVVTFKTTPENKEALISAAKVAGMDTSPYIEKQLELLHKLCNSEGVQDLFQKRQSQTANFLNKNGELVYLKLDSISDVLSYYMAIEVSYTWMMGQLKAQGKGIVDFATEAEKSKFAKEEEEKRKLALKNDVKKQIPPETN